MDAVEVSRSQLIMSLNGPGMFGALRHFNLGFGAALVIVHFIARHVASFAPAVNERALKGG